MSTDGNELESAASEALGKLTVLPAGSTISVSLVAAVCGCSLDEATYLVRVLLLAERLQVARRPGTRTDDPLYALTTSGQATHDAIRLDRADILRCWTDWLLVHASRAEAFLTPERPALSRTYRRLRPASLSGETQALAWLYSHRRDLIAAVHTADDRDWPEVRWQLIDAMWPLLKRADQRDTSISLHRGHGVPAARVCRDPAVLHRMLTNLGAALRAAGQMEEALAVLGEAAADARQHERQRDQAEALTGIAELHLEIGEHEAAAAAANTALELRAAVGDRHGTAITRVLVGDIASRQGRHETAVGHLERARRDLLAERNSLAAARALAALGRAHGRAGRPAVAEQLLHRAEQEVQHHQDRDGQDDAAPATADHLTTQGTR